MDSRHSTQGLWVQQAMCAGDGCRANLNLAKPLADGMQLYTHVHHSLCPLAVLLSEMCSLSRENGMQGSKCRATHWQQVSCTLGCDFCMQKLRCAGCAMLVVVWHEKWTSCMSNAASSESSMHQGGNQTAG